MPDAVTKSPQTLGGTSFGLAIYTEDVDAKFKKAIDAGAKLKRPAGVDDAAHHREPVHHLCQFRK